MERSLKKYCLIVFLLLILMSCENKWYSDFISGKIKKENILKELPIGSKYDQLTLYIKKNKIPKYEDNKLFGYSEKDYSKEIPPDFDIKLKNKLMYTLQIDAHKDYFEFPYYFHLILYFCYDKNDNLIYIGIWGYP
jgi:hypothetical protein